MTDVQVQEKNSQSTDFLDLYERYRAKNVTGTRAGYWTNFLGLETDCSMFPHAASLSGHHIDEPPIPDDKVYGTTTEHQAVLEAIAKAQEKGRRSFTMVELGAGWGPWIAGAGIVCQREGFEQVDLAGVEADRGKFEAMQAHFDHNRLTPKMGIQHRLIFGAAWSEDTTLKFPAIGMMDHGGAASEGSTEYRGFDLDMVDVPAFSLQTICKGYGIVDVMHWDVQGAEARIAQSARWFLNTHVRSIQIGTHSRAIEGELMMLFFDMGWEVVFQNPCYMQWNRRTPTLEGMTTRDGEIYARNPALWDSVE